MLATDNRLEAITILHFIGRIDTADVAIEYILRSRQQAGTCKKFAILQPCIALSKNKAIFIIVDTWALEVPSTTEPSC